MDFKGACKVLVERRLLPQAIASDRRLLQDHTKTTAMVRHLQSGKLKPLGSYKDAELHVKEGVWEHIDGMTSGKGGVMKIYISAAQPSRSPYTGLTGMNLTGPQNLVQTIYHEYMHHEGKSTHGPDFNSFSANSWKRKEGGALGGWIKSI